jgi:hypothetical protein
MPQSSIEEQDPDFARIRIGFGSPESGVLPLRRHVLEFTKFTSYTVP